MKNALIVDDTKNIRILLSKSLELEGFNVFTAKDSYEALDLLENTIFNIAFIDIKMPGMSGTALLEEIQNKGFNFPIVIMTAFGTIKNAVKTTKLGAKIYLQKPFSQATIQKTLEEIFGEDFSLNKSSNLNLKIKDTLYNEPLDSNSYLQVSKYLKELNNPKLSLAFKDFSNLLTTLEEKK